MPCLYEGFNVNLGLFAVLLNLFMASTARKILSNTLVQIAGKVGMAVVSIVTVKLITNYLGTSGYGEYSQVYKLLALFGIVADLGLFTIAVREMGKDEKQIPYVIGNILTVRFLAAFSTMLLGTIAVFFIPRYQGTYVPMGVAIASIGIFLTIVNGTISSVLQVHLKMHQATIALVLGRVVSLAYVFFAVYRFKSDQTSGFNHLMISGVAGAIIMTAITWFYTRKLTALKMRFDWDFWKKVVFASLPYGVALVLNMVYFQLNSIFLFHMVDSSAAGIFDVPSKVIEILSVVSIYFMNTVLPTLSKYIHDQKKPEYAAKARLIIQYCFDFLNACGMVIVAGTVVVAYPVIYVVTNEKFLTRLKDGFYGSDRVLQILIFALFFAYLNTLFSFILIALNKQNQLLKVASIGVVVNLFFNFLLIPKYGVRGSAITSVLSEFVILIATYFLTKKFFDYKLSFKNTFKALFSAVIMALILVNIREPLYAAFQAKGILLLIPLGGIIYGILMLLTGGISKEMIKMVRK